MTKVCGHLPPSGAARWYAVLPALAVLLVAMPAHAAEGLNYNVRIEAPKPLDELLQNNLDLVRFRGNPRTDMEQLQRLVKDAPDQVRTLVATAGYYNPTVTAQLERGGATPNAVVTVAPGTAVTVGAVDIELQGFTPEQAGSGQDSVTAFDANALKASWALKEGQVFRQADWESAKRALLRQVTQTRYPRAQLTETRATVDPETQRAALRVVLDSGPEMRFGALKIEGMQRYPATIVSNLNTIKPGDYYSEAALQAYQSRLQDTGYFSSVTVSADVNSMLSEQIDAAQQNQPGAASATDAPSATPATPPASNMAPLPLLVQVVENKKKNVSAGLGYSSNTGNRAQLNYDDLNVLGLKFKSALTLETKQQTAAGTFYLPTTGDGYNDSFGVNFVRADLEGETTATSTVFGKRGWGSSLLERTLTLEYVNEQKSINEVPESASKAVVLTYGLTKRHLDNLLFPTKGYVVSGTVGVAPVPILTDENFVRATAKFVYYLPLSASNTAIFRGEAGAVGSKEKAGIPSVYLFRAGGDQSVRGYAYQELGVQQGTATVGGRYLITGSAELQHFFTPTWGAATFYDAGNAADNIKKLGPKSGYGVGVRYRSPVGPINVDVAYGHATKKVRLHFSLGFTF